MAALVVALGLVLGAGTAQARAAAAPRVIAANVLAGLGVLPSAPADPSAPMVVGIALARPNPAGELALYRRVYQPGGPHFRHFLTPAGFAARFGVPAAMSAATATWLRGAGLAVDTPGAAGDYILAAGTVAQVSHAFSTTIRRFQSPTTSFLANTTAPSVPGDLPILSVLGLNTYQRFSTSTHVSTPGANPLGQLLSLTGAPNLFTTTPQSLWSIYDQPAADRGAGQSIAVFGSGASAGAISDLAQFEHQTSLPAVPVTVRNVGPGPFTDTSGAEEWDIDTQASTGMAPDAKGLTLTSARASSTRRSRRCLRPGPTTPPGRPRRTPPSASASGRPSTPS